MSRRPPSNHDRIQRQIADDLTLAIRLQNDEFTEISPGYLPRRILIDSPPPQVALPCRRRTIVYPPQIDLTRIVEDRVGLHAAEDLDKPLPPRRQTPSSSLPLPVGVEHGARRDCRWRPYSVAASGTKRSLVDPGPHGVPPSRHREWPSLNSREFPWECAHPSHFVPAPSRASFGLSPPELPSQQNTRRGVPPRSLIRDHLMFGLDLSIGIGPGRGLGFDRLWQSQEALPFSIRRMLSSSSTRAGGFRRSLDFGGELRNMNILPFVERELLLDWHAEDIGSVNRGAAVEDIESIPSFNVERGSPESSGDSQNCCICLESFVGGDRVKRLPCCHVFHSAEIDRWLAINKTCPICKTPIDANSE